MSLKFHLQESNTPTLTMEGRLDTHTAPSLDKILDGILARKGITRLVFDLGKLDYLSSAGIRCFVRARKALEPHGGKVAIRCRVRGPSFCNVAVLEELLPGTLLADSIAIVGSTDVVIGETDR